ncbi:transposase [Streptomyces cadmiisoli]|uniref:transposase n=1 Tax=Streptomyces cadmiisoli TaxID=2184053 RepID=UPI003D73917C
MGRRRAAALLALLGFRPDPLAGLFRPPHATTIRLVLAAADGDALDRAIGRFLQERQAPAAGRRLIAVDGKTLRGSRTRHKPATALIAAMTHDGQVLTQRQVDGKSNKIPAFAPLLDGIDPTHTVIADRRPAHPARPRLLPARTRGPLPGRRQAEPPHNP